MKLTNLSGWYKAMKNQNLTYNVYECKYNHIDFSILFDIGKTPFILSLNKRQTGEVITFNICGRHHTLKNHEKTRILYPDIYDTIKNKDISVRYK